MRGETGRFLRYFAPMSLDTILYPAAAPRTTFHVDVGEGHRLYGEEYGSPDGVPVVCLHGGPGMGALGPSPRFFDPTHYRIIQFDQRGALRSTPLGRLEGNTTWDLVADIETLRRQLGIDRWLVSGGSWGSALALAYAGRHQARVAGLILRGIFLGRDHEDAWQYQHGASELYPQAWKAFLAPIAKSERGDLIAAYQNILQGTDEDKALAAARAFLLWGLQTNTAHVTDEDRAPILSEDAAPFILAMARIAVHYAANRNFLERDDQLLDFAGGFGDLPGLLIHGSEDHACPVQSAHDLAARWPAAVLTLVEGAGHAPSEPALAKAVLKAIEKAKAWNV